MAWSLTKQAAARYGATATLLEDGTVLVAGGQPFNSDGTLPDEQLRSAVLYDPAADTWTAAGNLASGRFEHTATLLPDGRVLVVGGRAPRDQSLASAELYDPATRRWSAAPAMRGERASHAATLLDDGTVMVVGGYGNLGERRGDRADVEIFDPETGGWSDGPSLTMPRRLHTATLLEDGRVLVFGGDNAELGEMGAAEIYDPDLGVWLQGAFTASQRSRHTATLLEDGTVLIAGGGGDQESYVFTPR